MSSTHSGLGDGRLPLHGDVKRGAEVIVSINGRDHPAFLGETVAALLMASGTRIFRNTRRSGSGRGFYCGMGVCYDCLVVVDGRPNVRACMIHVRAGMRVETQHGWGDESEAPSE